MLALQLAQPQQWQLIDIPTPPTPGPGEALLRVRAVGICGTDIAGYLGKMPFFSYPRIPGHELGVTVMAVGEGVANVRPGQLCSVEPYLNCQKCYACRRGYTNCCETNQTLGVMCDGGLTSQIILPARKLHPAEALSPEQCALVETLAIGCHAVDRGGAQPGQNVLLLGAGPIGLAALEFVKLSGARPIVMDLSPNRLDFVRQHMGVADTILAQGTEADSAAVAELTNGQLADVVIDATGSHLSMARALEFAAFAGKIVYVGITQQTLAIPHPPHLHRRELSILASRNAPSRDFPRIIDLIAAGKIDTRPWITHRAAFMQIPEVFASWLDPGAGVIKAVVEME
ncbi:MAG: zinc-binding alcohol dehydrogenase family protein [Pirellulales bacterium]|nr:zinc-binding alcohol dehydrogenase family protein [Pirellulales bacterium]